MATTKDRRPRQPVSVTGRDAYLVLQALAYTILTIEALPERQQELSNKEQMKKLLDVWSRDHARDFLDNAERHMNCGRNPQASQWAREWAARLHPELCG
jgi:hypothetical protein